MEVRLMLKDYKILISKFTLITVGTIILGFGISLFIKPDIMSVIQWADKKISGTSKTQMEKFLQYVINNGIKVPFQMFILSLIPIPFAYYLPVALTAAATGVIFYLPFTPQLQDKMNFFSVFLGVLPHSIIEFFGFIVISAVLYQWNQAIRSHLFKKVNSEIGFISGFKKVVITYCFVAFPLLVVAGLIEAFITPMIK
jgi:uncharacterized membrane protein SpoIIM required for sporulation